MAATDGNLYIGLVPPDDCIDRPRIPGRTDDPWTWSGDVATGNFLDATRAEMRDVVEQCHTAGFTLSGQGFVLFRSFPCAPAYILPVCQRLNYDVQDIRHMWVHDCVSGDGLKIQFAYHVDAFVIRAERLGPVPNLLVEYDRVAYLFKVCGECMCNAIAAAAK